jgi:hypothetical protein
MFGMKVLPPSSGEKTETAENLFVKALLSVNRILNYMAEGGSSFYSYIALRLRNPKFDYPLNEVALISEVRIYFK